MEASVLEYIDFMWVKLNKLVIEDISYSDYDQMTDWLVEIKKQVRKLEKKQEPMYAGVLKMNCDCPACGETMEYEHNYCPECGQRLKWTED